MPADALQTPLISGAGDGDDDLEVSHPARQPADEDEGRIIRPSVLLWGLAVSAGISGLLFGYDTGVISATLVSIGSDLSRRPLTTADKSLITSSTSLCALVASPLSGVIADRFGRKKVLWLADVLFVGGALWQAGTRSVWGMIAGRSMVGLAVGGASLVVPLYLSELSPAPFRGRLVTLSCLLITFGQVLAYVAGYLLSTRAHGWRWMVGLGALPACVQLLTLVVLPESPRWLVKMKRERDALATLQAVYGPGPDVPAVVKNVIRRITQEIMQEEAAAARHRTHSRPAAAVRSVSIWREVFCVGGHRRALTIACLLQGLQQLCGFNSLMYFSATIFSLVGFTSPTLPSLSIALTNCLFTLVSFAFIDRVGRRPILLYSIPVMVIGLLLSALAFTHISLSLSLSPPSGASAVAHARRAPEAAARDHWPLVLFAALITYVAGYAIGLGNVPWQQSELFPFAIRSRGASLATATNWAGNFVVGLTFLPLMDWLTPAWTFVLYAAVCLLGWMAVWAVYPETSGLSLEDVGLLLRDGWGVDGRRSGRRGRGRESRAQSSS